MMDPTIDHTPLLDLLGESITCGAKDATIVVFPCIRIRHQPGGDC